MIKFGLLGKTLSYSLSPEIHKLIMKKLNIDGDYKVYEFQEEMLNTAVDWFKANDIKGVNVTIPYKVSVMKYIDKLSSEAENIGAINTIHFRDDSTAGYNTDYFGFKATLENFYIEVKNKSVLILGTGGAAASVYQCVKDMGAAEIKLASRSPENTGDIWRKKGAEIISYDELKNLEGDIIINCTPCGMHPKVDASPVPLDVIKKYKSAVDLVYNPEETLFLSYAAKMGLKSINGLYMLVAQAIESQRIWNGMDYNFDLIEDVYKKINNRK